VLEMGQVLVLELISPVIVRGRFRIERMRKVQDIESRGRCRIERKEDGSGYRE